jgi:hypothetical protein
MKFDLSLAFVIVGGFLFLKVVEILVSNWVRKPFNTERQLNDRLKCHDMDLTQIKTTLDLRFKEMDRKFAEICERLEDLEQRLDRIEQQVISILAQRDLKG